MQQALSKDLFQKPKLKTIGTAGEEYIAQALLQKGFNILERNYRHRCGEIDLICRKKDLIIFVEVKTRLNQPTDLDLSSVITFSKQQKIIKTALIYLARHQFEECTCRFDVALINNFASERITYIADAFRNTSY